MFTMQFFLSRVYSLVFNKTQRLLVCLIEEVLNRGISKLVNDKKILHMASPQGYLTPSHILYADDIFIFCRGDIKSLRNLSSFLKTYGDFSGQYVNNSKSSFFTMDNSARFVTKIQHVLSLVMVVCLSLIQECLSLLVLQGVVFFNLWLIKSN